MSSKIFPSLNLERELASTGARYVLGIDEVGRGAIAGPVAVGIAVIDMQSVGPWPAQLKDSKLIAPKVREDLVEPVKQWVVAAGVGYASAADIDEIGITKCLAMAAHRAFAELPTALHAEMQQSRSVAILDGSHNWLGKLGDIEIKVQTKADRDCASVAAASVLAKVERDELMVKLGAIESRFDWVSNKGYASPSQIEALQQFGPTDEHRKTWLSKILGDNKLFDL